MAGDRCGGCGQIAARVGEEGADIALLNVLAGKVLDLGNRAKRGIHGPIPQQRRTAKPCGFRQLERSGGGNVKSER